MIRSGFLVSREIVGRCQEADWQAGKGKLQTHLDFYMQLFNKQNMAKVSTMAMSGLALCLAVMCVAMPLHTGGPDQHFQPSPTGRALLHGAGTPQHGLSSNKMPIITSDCGTICPLDIKIP